VTGGHAFAGLGSGMQATRLGVLVATHNSLAAHMDRRVTIRDRQMVEMT